jgi:hypothetical protein
MNFPELPQGLGVSHDTSKYSITGFANNFLVASSASCFASSAEFAFN